MVADGKGKGKGRLLPQHPGPHAFKVLCPEELVSSLMGHGGRMKDQIQEEVGCKLVVSQRDEHFPGTRLRVLTVFHEAKEGIHAALRLIVGKIVECGEREKTLRPSGEPEFQGKEPGEYIFRGAVSPKMSGAIIGPKGARVSELRHRCRCRVAIDKDIHQDHQQLKLIAAPDDLVAALEEVNLNVQEEFDRDWFKQWVHSSVRAPGAGGYADWHQNDNHWNDSWRGQPQHHAERERSPRRSARPAAKNEWSAPVAPAWNAWEPSDWQGTDAQTAGGAGPSSEPDLRMLDMLSAIAADFPSEETFTVDYEINATMPRAKVSGLIGNKGSYVQGVRRQTGTQIHFDEDKAGGPDSQKMLIRGPLFGIYKAHMLMMKRYHEMEPPPPTEPPSQEELLRKVQELERQLAEAKGAGKGGKGKGFM
mmetsp:Transcript_2466/g.6147  ORF Transcript_2466/g.6147 Transcript_2466/m.6147 type:complete len:420 (+) Transcript_2466:67-1326(+)